MLKLREQIQHRKLAAIMFTDIVGYSAITQKNEPLALELLEYHNKLLRPIFKSYHGNEIKTMGDAFLVEFESALGAVQCAIKIQKSLFEHNERAEPDKRIQLRIGIHLGDVIFQENDVLGDGVNIASRIQPLADPGGICITEDIFHQIQNKIELPLIKTGKRQLKNIQIPVNIYKILLPWEKKYLALSERLYFNIYEKRKFLIPTLIILIILLILAIQNIKFIQNWFSLKKIETVQEKSIAVLPFENYTGKKDDEYFVDGMTEEVISNLSKIQNLNVIARTSVMKYKNTNKDINEIGDELNVDNIIEGSVRKSENKLRITVQLIYVKTQGHLWAENYDRELKDVFEIQSDVAQKIADALKLKLTQQEKQLIEKKPTANLTAYDYYLKGREYYNRFRREDSETAINLFKKALEFDSNYALAYTGISDVYTEGVQRFGYPDTSVDSAIAISNKAISIDPNLAEAHKSLGLGFVEKGWYKKALEEYNKATQLKPNLAVGNSGFVYFFIGELDKALLWMKKSTIFEPTIAYNYFGVGVMHLLLTEDIKAEQWFNKTLELQPDFNFANAGLNVLYLIQGKYQQAIEQCQKILSLYPNDFIGLNASGDAELFSGNYEKAKQNYEKSIGIYSTIKNYFSGRRNTTSLGYIFWKSGQKDKAEKFFNQSLDLDKKDLESGSEWYGVPYDIASINAIKGNKQEAYKWLQKAIDLGWRNYRIALRDPLLENLKNDEQFKQMMENVKTIVDEMRKKVEIQ